MSKVSVARITGFATHIDFEQSHIMSLQRHTQIAQHCRTNHPNPIPRPGFHFLQVIPTASPTSLTGLQSCLITLPLSIPVNKEILWFF